MLRENCMCWKILENFSCLAIGWRFGLPKVVTVCGGWLFFPAGPSAGLSFLGSFCRDYVQLLGQFLQPSQVGDSWTWFSFSFSASLSDIFCFIMHAISRNLQTISMNVCAVCVFCNVLCRNGLFENFERRWVGGMVVCIGIKPSAILSHDAHACWCHDGVGVI